VLCWTIPPGRAHPPGEQADHHYGLTSQADVQAREVRASGMGSEFELYLRGEKAGPVRLSVPGRHNVQNALGALAAAIEVGVPPEAAMKACAQYQGVKRRFERKGKSAQGAVVMDDYAHHPTEIRATLEAARSCWPDRRLVICFQPHRYTRTRLLFEEFTTAFYQADVLLVLDIYAASEKPEPGISAEKLAAAIRDHGHRGVEYAGSQRVALERLDKLLEPDDVFFTMGAGDVRLVGEKLVEDGEAE
jgi:UDP-N-acetylmuramate-alanine ligase